jgi:hypothetical protein
MALDTGILREVTALLKNSIRQKKVDTSSALSLVVRGMEIMDSYKYLNGQQKKDYILAVVQDMAKGADDNDVLPDFTLKALDVLLRENILDNFVNIVTDATKGKFDVNKAAATAVSCIGACFGGKK